MKRQSLIVALVLSLALAGSACGKVAVKQQLVLASSVTETSLGAAQDFERGAFASGTIPALTPAAHQQISAAFDKAFQAQVKSAVALLAWQAGQPVPSSVPELTADATAALALVHQLAPANQAVTDLVAKVQVFVNEANTLAGLFKK